jgi:hypothetical protein
MALLVESALWAMQAPTVVKQNGSDTFRILLYIFTTLQKYIIFGNFVKTILQNVVSYGGHRAIWRLQSQPPYYMSVDDVARPRTISRHMTRRLGQPPYDTVVPYSPTIVGGVLCLPPQVCTCHMIGQLCQVGGSTAKANKTLVNQKR